MRISSANTYPVLAQPSVRFGNLGLIGSVAPSLMEIINQQKKNSENQQKRGRFMQFAFINLLLTPALGLALANIDTLRTELRKRQNAQDAVALETLLPVKHPDLVKDTTFDPHQLIAAIRNSGIIPSEVLIKAGKAGFVKEVIVQGPNVSDGIIVFKDGHEALADNLNWDLKSKLVGEYNAPLRRPALHNLKFDTGQAFLLAALIVNSLNIVLLGATGQGRTASREEKLRRTASMTGRLIAARKLKISEELLDMGELDRQLNSQDFLRGVRPQTIQELINRQVVLLAGKLSEERLMGGNPSVISANAGEISSMVFRLMVKRMGLGGVFAPYVPLELNDTDKKNLETAVREQVEKAMKQASEILDGYSQEQLVAVHRTLQRQPFALKSDLEDLLAGKDLSQTGSRKLMRATRNLLQRLNPMRLFRRDS